jgi:hypothetical protein
VQQRIFRALSNSMFAAPSLLLYNPAEWRNLNTLTP